MSDPLSALQPAVYSALTGAAAVESAMGGTARVYDRVPTGAVFPYLRIDITDITEDDDGCGKHWVCAVNVHIWSRATGRQEASQIAGPVRDAIDGIGAVTGYAINYVQFRQTRIMDDPDGLTTHGVVTAELHLSAT